MTPLKVLNLYAGIGGNRKLWPNERIKVTAIENNQNIAEIYSDFFPKDRVIIEDAHQYLLENYEKFDFIWSSPPCPSHSKLRYLHKKKIYPDMKLQQEIIFLNTWFSGKWVVENVDPYYEPLQKPIPIKLGRHLFWANFKIKPTFFLASNIKHRTINDFQKKYGFDLKDYNISDKRKILRNCVAPEVGLYVFNEAFKEVK
jgi:DNA (cytosine-5)-methyltransferase 1